MDVFSSDLNVRLYVGISVAVLLLIMLTILFTVIIAVKRKQGDFYLRVQLLS